jgi:ketosteroid isomerase-like protein
MVRPPLAIALAVLPVVLGSALGACRPAGEAPRDPTADIQRAAAAFDQAQLRRDRAALERFLADDVVFVRGSGKVEGKAAFLATFTDPALVLDPFTIRNPVFVRLGDQSGLVGGEAILTGTESGKRFSEHIHYADVFTWRDGRWQVVHVQVTPIP